MRDVTNKIKQLMKDHPFQSDPAYHLPSLKKAPQMASIIWEIKEALRCGMVPEKIKHSSTNVFLFRDRQNQPLAIFKTMLPSDVMRELAAFYLDHQSFAMVPPVVYATFNHPLFGNRNGTCHLYMGDGNSLFGFQIHKTFADDSIRRIAAFDIRVLNGDRHFANFVREGKQVFPIDHTTILPSIKKPIHIYYDWIKWEQAKTPFNQCERAYIESIDPEKDRALLLELGLSSDEGDMLYVTSTFLKMGVKQGLTAFDLGMLISKPMEGESPFSMALKKIRTDTNGFTESVQQEMGWLFKRRGGEAVRRGE